MVRDLPCPLVRLSTALSIYPRVRPTRAGAGERASQVPGLFLDGRDNNLEGCEDKDIKTLVDLAINADSDIPEGDPAGRWSPFYAAIHELLAVNPLVSRRSASTGKRGSPKAFAGQLAGAAGKIVEDFGGDPSDVDAAIRVLEVWVLDSARFISATPGNWPHQLRLAARSSPEVYAKAVARKWAAQRTETPEDRQRRLDAISGFPGMDAIGGDE
ncbi:MAG: hypothetical protein IPG34_19725 [Rhodocyclaceae bacterium]|nr:hypothetical protein [Rhodocyclaceae bacterium]